MKKNLLNNKYFIQLVAFIIFLIIFFFVLEKPEKNKLNLKQNKLSRIQLSDKELLEEKSIVFKQYLKDADSIANLTNNSKASKIISFLKEYGRLSVPVLWGARSLEDTSSGKWIAIVLLAPGDELVCKEWFLIVKSSSVAAYHNGIKALILRPNNEAGVLSRSLTILHEGMHAMEDYQKNGRIKTTDSPLEICSDEKNVYNFINSLMLKLGGKEYSNLLSTKIEERHQQMLALNVPLDEHYKVGLLFDDRLDQIFGPIKSQYDKDVWRLSFEIHLYFKMIEKYYHGDKEKLKALFFQEVYVSQGLIAPKDKFK